MSKVSEITFNIVILILCSMSVSCSVPKEKNITDNDVSIKLSVKDVSDTKLKFVTRGVGLDKKRGFHIIMSVDDRNSIVIYRHLNMKSKPEGEYLSEIASSLEAVASPDKKHVAVSFADDTIKKTYLYHLLATGEPFIVEKYNQPIQGTNIDEIEWNTIPEPEKIAIEFIKEGIDTASNYPILNSELWSAVSETVPGGVFDELIIQCWPNVFEAQDVIDSVMAKNTDYNKPFFKQLAKRAEEVFEENSSTTNIICAIVVGYEFGDENLRAISYNHLIRIWPESPTLDKFVRKVYSELPDTIQSKLIDKSILHYKQTDSYAYKTPNKKFLYEYADSLTLEKLNK